MKNGRILTEQQRQELRSANTDALVIAYVNKYGGSVWFNGRACAIFNGVAEFYETIDIGGDDNQSNFGLDPLGSY